MAIKSMFRCNCGQRLVAKDVMQTGYYLRLFGPSFVYVKFRCSRCKKLGEQFVKQEDWEDGILRDTPNEITPEEKDRFEQLGPIDIDEVIDAHFRICDEYSLRELLSGPELTARPDGDDKK